MDIQTDIRMIWQDIEQWLAEHATDRAGELRPGADDAAIEALAAMIAIPIPADYVASLRCHDGQVDLTDYTYLSIGQACSTWAGLKAQDEAGNFAGRRVDDPGAARIQPRWWSAAWLPFAKDGGGNLLCVDLAPGPRGKSGQVLRFERSMGPGYAGWGSFRDWLAAYRDGLISGAYAVDADGFIRDR